MCFVVITEDEMAGWGLMSNSPLCLVIFSPSFIVVFSVRTLFELGLGLNVCKLYTGAES